MIRNISRRPKNHWPDLRESLQKNRPQIQTANSVLTSRLFSHRIYCIQHIRWNLTRSTEIYAFNWGCSVFEQFIRCELMMLTHFSSKYNVKMKNLFVAMRWCVKLFIVSIFHIYYTRKMFSCHIDLK